MRAALARHGRRLVIRQTRAASTSSCALYAAPPPRRRQLPRPVTCRISSEKRTFLDAIFQKPPREVRPPEYEPGWMQIMVWRTRVLDHVRGPPKKDLRAAWRQLFEFKWRNKVPLNSDQALQCRRLLQHLVDVTGDGDACLSGVELYMARRVLIGIEPFERTREHLDLARALHDLWLSGRISGTSSTPVLPWSFLIRAMGEYGASREALRLFLSHWNKPEYAAHMAEKNDRLVQVVVKGLAREGREEELLELVSHVESQGTECGADIQAVMVEFFAQRDRIVETQHWFDKHDAPRPLVYPIIASFAMRNNLEEWVAHALLKLGQAQPKKAHWDALLQALLITGKGMDAVETLISHMVHRQVGIGPDAATINGLLGVAVEARSSALADKVLALAATKEIAPDAGTYLALAQLRLHLGDLEAARRAFAESQNHEPWADTGNSAVLHSQYRRLVNEYLVALCAQPRPDFKYISSLLELIEEQQVRLVPATIATLSLRFLENDQHFDVMDLLAAYSFTYSEAERETVQTALIGFSLAAATSTNRSWGAYQILYQFFPDTTLERRVDLMDGFFSRKRPDLAAQVFGHMRAHPSKSYHPQPETYIRCLEGFAQHADPEGLDMVHNMLKMDVFVKPSTRLYTALMLAYTACDRPLLALDFWHEITLSPTGPTYESLEAVFWALERKPGGHVKARDLWDRIERMDLDLTPGVYNAYIGAVAGDGNEKEVKSLILRMANLVGSAPDTMTLGIAYNALPTQELQAAFGDWAEAQYPHIWADLLKMGRWQTEYSLCQFRIRRALKA